MSGPGMNELQGRTALVTGGASGIGAACARDLGGDDDATRAMLRYAEVRTLDAEAAHPEAAEALARHFDAATRAGIRATIDMFTFTNRFNNTWEAILPGAARRRRRFDPA